MAMAIAMPRLGMTMQEGTLVRWYAAIGDPVVKGAPLLVIESEKAEVTIEAPATGVLRHVYVEPGVCVPCGTVLAAMTDTADEALDVEAFRAASEKRAGVTVEDAPRTAAADARSASERSPRKADVAAGHAVTPAARRRARDLGIDTDKIPGSGPAGRVTREDVEAFAERYAARVRVADDVFLEVARQGDGEPVVLLPGFGSDVSAFARIMPMLGARYLALAVNPRGVGLSEAPDEPAYDVAGAAGDAAAVATGTVHVIGASLGSAVALEIALRYPERVRSLTLLTPFVVASARLLAVLEAWCRLGAEVGPQTLARAIVPWMFSERFLAEPVQSARAVQGFASAARNIPADTLARAAAGLRAWSGTRTADLARIEVPTLVVAAAEDLLVPEVSDVVAGITHAQLVRVRGSGHAVALEAPDAVATAVLEHLQRASEAH